MKSIREAAQGAPKKLGVDDLQALARLAVEGKAPKGRAPAELEALAERAGVLELVGAKKALAKKFPRARQAYLAQGALGAARLEAFREIAAAMAKKNIPLIPQKGMAYALMFERGGPVRHMADLDFLVRPADFARAAGVLGELGYEEFKSHPRVGTRFHNERQFRKGDQMVELHRAFLSPGRVRIDYQDIWRRARPLEREGIRCLRLCPEDTFLYHCFHFAMHEFSVAGLRHIVELDRLLEKDRPDLETSARRAREWGILRMCFCALRLYQICLPERVKDDLVNLFRPSRPWDAVLEILVVQPSVKVLLEPGLLPRHSQLLRKFLMVDRLRSGVKYFLWYLVAEAEGKMQR